MYTSSTSNGHKFETFYSFHNYWMLKLSNYANCKYLYMFIPFKMTKICIDINPMGNFKDIKFSFNFFS